MEVTKKQTSPLVYIGIGFLTLLFIVGVGLSIFFKFFAKKTIEGVIQNKTGVNVSNVQTGANINVSGEPIPYTFPKDFPLYPGAKVTSSLSGSESGKTSGYWLTMTTSDSVDKVIVYYKSQLAANGWTMVANLAANGITTETVTKNGWTGSVALNTDSSNTTQIVIILGQETISPTPTGN